MIHFELNQDGQLTVVTDKHIRWFAFFWLLLGILSVLLPIASTLTMELVIAAILTVAGATRCSLAITHRNTSNWVWSFAMGLFVVVLGSLLLVNTNAGVVTLSLLLVSFFLIESIISLSIAMRLKRAGLPWQGFTLNGFFHLTLVGIIMYGWPETALWLPGVLVGVSMISLALMFWRFTATNNQ